MLTEIRLDSKLTRYTDIEPSAVNVGDRVTHKFLENPSQDYFTDEDKWVLVECVVGKIFYEMRDLPDQHGGMKTVMVRIIEMGRLP